MGKNLAIGALSFLLLVTAAMWVRERNFRQSAEQMLCGCARVIHACEIASGKNPEPIPFEKGMCD